MTGIYPNLIKQLSFDSSFIANINRAFNDLRGFVTSQTVNTITTTLIGQDLVNAINSNFSTFDADLPSINNSLFVGMTGIQFLSYINTNFTAKIDALQNEPQDDPVFFNRPIVILTIDDCMGINSGGKDYDVMMPLAQSLDVSFTGYVVSGQPTAAAWVKLKEMYDAGIDLQCHGYFHSNEGKLGTDFIIDGGATVSLTEEILRQNFTRADSKFLSKGIPAPIHHCPPYVSMSPYLRTVMKDYRLSARGSSDEDGWGTLVIDSVDNQKYIRKNSNINRTQTVNYPFPETYEDIIADIDGAIALNQAFHYYCHSWLVTPSVWEDVIQYCQANGVEVLNVSQFYFKYGHLVTGISDGTLTFFNPTITASIADANKDKVVISTTTYALRETPAPDISAFELVGKTITDVTISGFTVTLTVSVPYVHGANPFVRYTYTPSDPLMYWNTRQKIGSFYVEVANHIV